MVVTSGMPGIQGSDQGIIFDYCSLETCLMKLRKQSDFYTIATVWCICLQAAFEFGFLGTKRDK